MCSHQRRVDDDLGAAAAIRNGVLRHRVDNRIVPFAPTKFDLELLDAIDAAVAMSTSLAIVLPQGAVDAPIIVAASALVAAIVREGSLEPQVALASRRLRSRTSYDDLYYNDQRLAAILPRTRLDADGVPHDVGTASTKAHGRLHITSDSARLATEYWRTIRLAGLVVSADATDMGRLRTLIDSKQHLIYITDDAADPCLDLVRDADGVVWAFDPPSLTALAGAGSYVRGGHGECLWSTSLLTVADGTRIIDVPDEADPLDEALREVWRRLSALTAVYADGETAWGVASATCWAWGVFNTLSSAGVSASRYDAAVRHGPYSLRLLDAPAAARAFAASVTRGSSTSDAWYRLADAFEDALGADHGVRGNRIASWIADRVVPRLDRGSPPMDRVAVIVRNAIAVVALQDALDEHPGVPFDWDSVVDVIAIGDIARGRAPGVPYGEILFVGPVPRAHAVLLAIPPAAALTVLAAGPWEASRAVRQVRAALTSLTTLRTETVTRSAPRLGLDVSPSPPTDLDKAYAITTAAPLPIQAADEPGNAWEPFSADILALISVVSMARDIHQAKEAPAPTRGADTILVNVLTVTLGTGQVLLVEPNEMITRRRGAEVERVAAKALRPGDGVVLVDGAARRDIFTSVTDSLGDHPAYLPLTMLVGYWHSRARRAHRTNVTYGTILTRMKGTRITSPATVGSWIRGDVDGPDDVADIARFARAIGDPELESRAGEVGIALKVLRRVHLKVGVWLSAYLASVGGRAEGNSKNELVDTATGLRVRDLIEAIDVQTVTSIDPILRWAATSACGQPLSVEQAVRAMAAPTESD
jgi:hypothetical protein